MKYHNTLQRFIFEAHPIRGNIVQLNSTYTDALAHHNYPAVLRNALGELMAAAALLVSTLKMQGALVLQIQGSGALKLLVVECKSNLEMRATAKFSDELLNDQPNSNFIDLIGNGHFVITLDPKEDTTNPNAQPYQGIVPLEGDSIAAILQNYMYRSEQIETNIWLACDNDTAAGMLVQKLPEIEGNDADAWNRINSLADTVKPSELLNDESETLLNKLFVEEDVRLFDAEIASFKCSCSRSNVGNMLKMLGENELTDILKERETVDVNCDFCNAAYRFDVIDIEQLFVADTALEAGITKH